MVSILSFVFSFLMIFFSPKFNLFLTLFNHSCKPTKILGDDWTEEDLADFFQTEAPIRISTLSSERMIVARLQNLFGENELFNDDVAAEMKRNMIKDLEENRKEEYMSEPGKFSLHWFFLGISTL